LHPLESAAFSRRTSIPAIRGIEIERQGSTQSGHPWRVGTKQSPVCEATLKTPDFPED
jgi:hypothetical protein